MEEADTAVSRAAKQKKGEPATALNFTRRLLNALSDIKVETINTPNLSRQSKLSPEEPITRADACRLIFQISAKS